MMRSNVENSCSEHSDRFDCPDCLIGTFGDGSYGILIHDGSQSMVTICYCPWCGTELPKTD
jgi:hypothetical protein